MGAINALRLFPKTSAKSRAEVHTIVEQFARGEITRSELHWLVGKFMKQQQLKKMNVLGYKITLLIEPWDDAIQDGRSYPISVVQFEGTTIVDKCPCCGSPESRLLFVNKQPLFGGYDVVTVVCQKCMCVYKTKGENGNV